ncbi:Na+/H+ antiporter subunit E [bacterium SCSIO 12827]|nr:Na+/H+ antiporter subunit E [bacterium SCSIO 12827]
MLHAISLSIGLAALWWLLSGYTIPLILAFGAGSVALVVFIAHRMDVVDHEGHPIQVTWRWLTYLPWLGKEIVTANIDVVKAVLSPKGRVHTSVLRTKATQKTELGHVIYANSITLTPGTVTLAVEDGVMIVHALTRGAADGLKSGEMDRRCTAVEGAPGEDR